MRCVLPVTFLGEARAYHRLRRHGPAKVNEEKTNRWNKCRAQLAPSALQLTHERTRGGAAAAHVLGKHLLHAHRIESRDDGGGGRDKKAGKAWERGERHGRRRLIERGGGGGGCR